MNEVIAPDLLGNPVEERACEKCGVMFLPRARTGGRPQKFCSEECRRKFHAQASPTPPTPIGENTPPAVLQPTIETATQGEDYEPEFYWFDDPDNKPTIVIPSQAAVAVYINVNDAIVIRQENRPDDDDDSIIVIERKNLRQLIERLEEMERCPE